jgi:hypothetical protein
MQQFTVTKLILLTLFKEIIAICTENRTKRKYMQTSDCPAGGMDIYHYALKG